MLSVVAVLALSGQQDPASVAIIGAMRRKYADTLSMSGNIVGATSDGVGVVETYGEFKFLRPSYFYLRQNKLGSNPQEFIARSDGTLVCYPEPIDQFGRAHKTLYETVRLKSGHYMTVTEIYQAALRGFPDRGIVYPLLFGDKQAVVDWAGCLSTMEPPKSVNLKGESVKEIEGLYRTPGARVPTGRYEIYVGADGLLRRYLQTERISDYSQKPPIDTKIAVVYDVGVNLDPDLTGQSFPVVK